MAYLYSLTFNEVDKYQHPIFNKKMSELIEDPKIITPKKEGWVDFPDKYLKEIEENFKALDKHMIWVAGGALSLLILFFDKDKILLMSENSKILLRISMLSFSICLWSVISSFYAMARLHAALDGVRKATFIFTQRMDQIQKLTPEQQKEILADKKKSKKERWKLESCWHSLVYFTVLITFIPKTAGILNFISYSLFTLGVFAVIAFGIATY
jgi:hypothetical protein